MNSVISNSTPRSSGAVVQSNTAVEVIHNDDSGEDEEIRVDDNSASVNVNDSSNTSSELQNATTANEYDGIHESIAVSAALVGEAVVETPEQEDKGIVHFTIKQHQLPDFPNLATSELSRTAPTTRTPTITHQRPRKPATTTAKLTNPPLAKENTNAVTVGLMAQGLHWVRRQKEYRQRKLLQTQAEQQLMKIRQAQVLQQQQQEAKEKAEMEANAENSSTARSSFFGTTSFRSFFDLMAPSSSVSSNGPLTDEIPLPDSRDSDEVIDFTKSASISKGGYSVKLKIPSRDEEDEDAAYVPPVRIELLDNDDLDSNPFILKPEQRQQCAVNVLPRGIAYCRWVRLYSIIRDGDSFENCLRCCAGHQRTLLVVRTSTNEILGGYADSVWQPHIQGGTSYYGGSSACLFMVHSETGKVRPFKWTGANRYTQLCDRSRKMLAFGGGGVEGAFGLSVEQDFQIGSTGPCATFDNEPLCSVENFDIVDMEIYGFLVGQF